MSYWVLCFESSPLSNTATRMCFLKCKTGPVLTPLFESLHRLLALTELSRNPLTWNSRPTIMCPSPPVICTKVTGFPTHKFSPFQQCDLQFLPLKEMELISLPLESQLTLGHGLLEALKALCAALAPCWSLLPPVEGPARLLRRRPMWSKIPAGTPDL